MCELCDEKGRQYALRRAEMYTRMAYNYRRVADGSLKPHTEEFQKETSGTANAILRDIVDGWSLR